MGLERWLRAKAIDLLSVVVLSKKRSALMPALIRGGRAKLAMSLRVISVNLKSGLTITGRRWSPMTS